MKTQTITRNGFDKWRDGLDSAVGDARWDIWDCDIKHAVNEYNRHLAGTTGYVHLDWRFIKAMLWVETGAHSADWKIKPMRIGVAGDLGLHALLAGNEGGDLIVPRAFKNSLSMAAVTTIAVHNIRAGIGYLLMRLATYEHRSVIAPDSKVYEVIVKAGDNMEKIARTHGSTIDVLKNRNPTAHLLRPGQTLKYQKAMIKQVIKGWRQLSTALIANRYNGGRDQLYGTKLDYALSLLQKRKAVLCAQ